jgi:hypothetical protein
VPGAPVSEGDRLCCAGGSIAGADFFETGGRVFINIRRYIAKFAYFHQAVAGATPRRKPIRARHGSILIFRRFSFYYYALRAVRERF